MDEESSQNDHQFKEIVHASLTDVARPIRLKMLDWAIAVTVLVVCLCIVAIALGGAMWVVLAAAEKLR